MQHTLLLPLVTSARKVQLVISLSGIHAMSGHSVLGNCIFVPAKTDSKALGVMLARQFELYNVHLHIFWSCYGKSK